MRTDFWDIESGGRSVGMMNESEMKDNLKRNLKSMSGKYLEKNYEKRKEDNMLGHWKNPNQTTYIRYLCLVRLLSSVCSSCKEYPSTFIYFLILLQLRPLPPPTHHSLSS